MMQHSEKPQALYRFYNEDRELLYIGTSSEPGKRFQRHRDDKVWWQEVKSITLAHYPDLISVREAEKNAILEESPKYNKAHNQVVQRTTSRPAEPTIVLSRTAPIQQYDWIALGMKNGECLVGEVQATDDRFISVALAEHHLHAVLIGTDVRCLKWDDVERMQLTMPEFYEEGVNLFGPLEDMQRAWNRTHTKDNPDFYDIQNKIRTERTLEEIKARREEKANKHLTSQPARRSHHTAPTS